MTAFSTILCYFCRCLRTGNFMRRMPLDFLRLPNRMMVYRFPGFYRFTHRTPGFSEHVCIFQSRLKTLYSCCIDTPRVISNVCA